MTIVNTHTQTHTHHHTWWFQNTSRLHLQQWYITTKKVVTDNQLQGGERYDIIECHLRVASSHSCVSQVHS